MKKDEIKCYCGKWAKPAKIKVEGLLVDGWVCKSCSEQYLTPEASLQISALKKVLRKPIEAKITKVGNSFSLRIRKEVADAMALKSGKKLKIELKNPKKALLTV